MFTLCIFIFIFHVYILVTDQPTRQLDYVFTDFKQHPAYILRRTVKITLAETFVLIVIPPIESAEELYFENVVFSASLLCCSPAHFRLINYVN